MIEHEKQLLIEKILSKNRLCFKNETITDVEFLENSWLKNKKRWKRNRRLWTKFRKRIRVYLTKRARRELFARAFSQPLRTRLDYESIGRKCFSVEPLSVGGLE